MGASGAAAQPTPPTRILCPNCRASTPDLRLRPRRKEHPRREPRKARSTSTTVRRRRRHKEETSDCRQRLDQVQKFECVDESGIDFTESQGPYRLARKE